jgi:hypothetical protein
VTTIVLVTITDRMNFGATLDRCAFPHRANRPELTWAEERVEHFRSPDCDPVVSFELVDFDA